MLGCAVAGLAMAAGSRTEYGEVERKKEETEAKIEAQRGKVKRRQTAKGRKNGEASEQAGGGGVVHGGAR